MWYNYHSYNLINDLGFPTRINPETNSPEWKDVGADTWNPFKSSGGEVKDLLWVNPNFNSFAAQTVSLDLSGYKECIIEFADKSSSQVLCSRLLMEKNNSMYSYTIHASSGNAKVYRMVKILETGVNFNNAYDVNSTATRNEFMIPLNIYGLRNGIPSGHEDPIGLAKLDDERKQSASGTVSSSGLVLTATLQVKYSGLYYLTSSLGGSAGDGIVIKNNTSSSASQITPVNGFNIVAYRTMITELKAGDKIYVWTINSGSGAGSRSASISIAPIGFIYQS